MIKENDGISHFLFFQNEESNTIRRLSFSRLSGSKKKEKKSISIELRKFFEQVKFQNRLDG